MTTYARVINNEVVEIFIPLPGFTLEESFTPEVAALFQEVPNGVKVGWIFKNGKWVKP